METKTWNTVTVAEIVTADYRTAALFKKHGIDFCCGGKKSVQKACAEKNINIEVLTNEIANIQAQPPNELQNVQGWSLAFLADYIVNVHHKYVNNNVGLIAEFAQKVAKVHGETHPETIEIAGLFSQVVGDLTVHMKKEELLLFPYIKNVEKLSKGEIKQLPASHFGTVKNPIRIMMHEHDLAGTLMKQIELLSNNFTTPANACNTFRVLYAKLNEFQDDLHQHVHLENNILFPNAISAEESLEAANTDETSL